MGEREESLRVMVARIDERQKVANARLLKIEAAVEKNNTFRLKLIAWATAASATTGFFIPFIAKFILAKLSP